MRFGFFCLVICVFTAACSSRPSDGDLEAEFKTHRSDFDTLADMATEDSDYSRISYDFVHPRWDLPEEDRPGDPPAERWQAYRRAFKKLNLQSGVTNYENGVVVLERSSSGLVTAGSSVGYMRASELPSSVEVLDKQDDLDCSPTDDGWCAAAKNLSGDWYLFIERH